MIHTFYCKTCDKDHSIDLYAGNIGQDKYCLKHMAGAINNMKIATKAHRASEIAKEAAYKADIKTKSRRASPRQEKAAADLKERADRLMYQREDRLINDLNSYLDYG